MGASSKRFELIGIVFLPIAFVVFLFVGALFSVFASIHSWGIATPIILVVFLVLLGYLAKKFTHLARVQTGVVAVLCSLVLFLGYWVGEVFVAMMFEGGGPSALFGGRWDNGYELFGAGSFAIKGWLWGLGYVSRVLLVLLVLMVVMAVEASREFCGSCRRHATKVQWKAIIGSFDLAMLKHVNSVEELIKFTEDGQGTTQGDVRAVKAWIVSCKCKRIGYMTADVYDRESKSAGKRIISDLRVSQSDLLDLCDWIDRVDPKVPHPGRVLEMIEDFAPVVSADDHVPFDRLLEPDGTEWESKHRLDGSGLAVEWRCDTEYTKALRKQVAVGDYLTIPEALARAININDTACIYESVADWDGPRDWIEYWCDDEPENSQAHTVRGINLVKQAWIKRGGGWTPKNYPEFQALLEQAMETLDTATGIEPSNATAHAWKIYAGKGLMQGRELVRLHFDLATGDHPDLFGAHWMYHDYVTEKWGGSDEECLAFGRDRLEVSQVGSPSCALVCFSHFELAGTWHQQDEKEGMKNYFEQPEVRAEILRSNKRTFTDHRMSMVTPRVRAFMAYMLWQTGHIREARSHMEIMGKRTPWDPFPASVMIHQNDTYAKARKACGL